MSGANQSKYSYPLYSPAAKAKIVPGLEQVERALNHTQNQSVPIQARQVDEDALLQFKLKGKINGYFILNKDLYANNICIPSGTCGRIVQSKAQQHAIVATFATPYDNIETIADPDEYFTFGMSVCVQLVILTMFSPPTDFNKARKAIRTVLVKYAKLGLDYELTESDNNYIAKHKKIAGTKRKEMEDSLVEDEDSGDIELIPAKKRLKVSKESVDKKSGSSSSNSNNKK